MWRRTSQTEEPVFLKGNPGNIRHSPEVSPDCALGVIEQNSDLTDGPVRAFCKHPANSHLQHSIIPPDRSAQSNAKRRFSRSISKPMRRTAPETSRYSSRRS